MSLIVLVQAREGGTRLPGKIKADLGTPPGVSMLAHVLSRASQLGPLILAMPGPEEAEDDVLGRLSRIARAHPSADAFARITADCPLLDVGIGGYCINRYRERQSHVDGVFTAPEMDGLDVEVFSRTALLMADLNAKGRHAREHPTHWMRKNLGADIVNFAPAPLRWSVDDAGGLDFVRRVYAACPHCAEGIPRHTNANGSIGGSDRVIVAELHHMPAGDLDECRAYDIMKERMGVDTYVSQ
jgi:spore coat polysaccharide biosynthesis protein SpsF (cytidylyltransferase family)